MHGETSFAPVAEQRVHVAHVLDVMEPPESQTCALVPARARTHTVGWRVMVRGAWWHESLWCGCGCTALRRGLV